MMLVIQSTQLTIENSRLLKEQKLPYFAMEQVIHFCFDSQKHVGLQTRYHESLFTKGQFISKCPFGVIIWTKTPMKISEHFCPRI
jgi:hypothetical protein